MGGGGGCGISKLKLNPAWAELGNIMSQEVTFEQTKIFTFTGRNLLSQEEFSQEEI